MKNRIMNNFSLKIVSVLLAILTWLVVVNIDNPLQTRTIDGIKITVQNGSYIEDLGQTYKIEDGNDTISISVSGKRSDVEKLSASDFTAVADLTQIISLKTSPIMVPITVSCSNSEVTNIAPHPQAMEIAIEKLSSADFIISTSTGDTKPAKGYEVGTAQVNPEKVTITGPESTISKIDQVVAQIDVADIDNDTTLDAKLRIIDKNQDVMSDAETKYLRYSDSVTNSTVSVDVTLWKLKSDVGILAGYKGSPADGYQVADVSTTPEMLSIVGSDEALKMLAENGNVIEIPEDAISVEGKTADFEEKIDITKYLPEGIRLAADVSSSVLVTVDVLPEGSKEYQLATSSIQVQNKPNGYGVLYNNEKVMIRVKGLDADLESLALTDIEASIDLSDAVEGENVEEVMIKLPSGYEQVDSVTVTLQLEKTVDNTE